MKNSEVFHYRRLTTFSLVFKRLIFTNPQVPPQTHPHHLTPSWPLHGSQEWVGVSSVSQHGQGRAREGPGLSPAPPADARQSCPARGTSSPSGAMAPSGSLPQPAGKMTPQLGCQRDEARPNKVTATAHLVGEAGQEPRLSTEPTR